MKEWKRFKERGFRGRNKGFLLFGEKVKGKKGLG